MEKVLVYGTLMSGLALNSAIGYNKCLGPTTVKGLKMYDCGAYPFCVRDKSSEIYGEVYAIDNNTLDALDRIEGVSTGLYTREPIETEYGEAYVYLAGPSFDLDNNSYTEIKNGDWKEYVLSNWIKS